MRPAFENEPVDPDGAGKPSDQEGFAALLTEHRGYLLEVVRLRLDREMLRRVDPSDVVQESLLEAVRRMPEYQARRPMPLRLWLRKTVQQKLVDLHRRHVGAERRSVLRELPLPASSSLLLVQTMLGKPRRPDSRAARDEAIQLLREAVASLSDEDREVILLRNFEQLTNLETAELLDIAPAAASKRYGRAVLRLRDFLASRGLTGSES